MHFKQPNKQRIILHLDFDSFFASVEQQCNPLLRNVPVGVTATNGRTCIIASSREAKELGIKTASRTQDALRICPQIQFVPANFWKYWEVSKQFIAIGKEYSPYIEVFSIDEMFIDVTTTAHLFGGVDSLIAQIKKRIKEEIGEYITISVGVSYNKLLAKLASGLKKPNGVFKISPFNLDAVYQVAPLGSICGVGFRIEERLNHMGIRTLLQLRKTPLSALIAEFGNVEGHFLRDVSLGNDVKPVVAYTQAPETKSVGRQYCLAKNEHDQRRILQTMYELYEEVGIKLRRLNKKARSAGLFLYGSYSIGGNYTQSRYIDSGKDLFQMGMEVIKRESESLPVGYVRRLGVWAGNLEDTSSLTSSLLMDDQKQEKLLTIMDSINEKFGDHTIRNGFLLQFDKLTTVPNGWMADRFERQRLATEL